MDSSGGVPPGWVPLVLQVLSVLLMGLVGIFLAWLKRRVEAAHADTKDAQAEIHRNSEDQARGFKDTGQRYYQMSERLRVLEENMVDVKRRMEKVPTTSQWGYRRPKGGEGP